jgi:hypothetical protein
MFEMNIDFAKNVTAHYIAAEAVRRVLENPGVLDWNEDISEEDRNQIIAEVVLIEVSLRPHIQDVEESLIFLEKRADGRV